MKEIKLTVTGNQEKKDGNPIPYFRTTQKGQFNKGAKRYHAWKDYVRAQYYDALKEVPKKVFDKVTLDSMHDFLAKKPIKATNRKVHMKLLCTFIDKTHADCDNIFKGIADALFMNDKYLSGEFDYTYGEQGKVEVTITFY